jgi:type IV secretory pathway protease TraF
LTEGETAPARPESRALVTLTPPVQAAAAPTGYRPAPFQVPFLAHLLAVKGQHAQTRERRRAEPHEALAAYRATARLVR